MTVAEVKSIAEKLGIKVGRMKKAELIRTIQIHESNEACYETGKSGECGQDLCLWRDDCK